MGAVGVSEGDEHLSILTFAHMYQRQKVCFSTVEFYSFYKELLHGKEIYHMEASNVLNKL